jgi:PAS domain S-box-containing protein
MSAGHLAILDSLCAIAVVVDVQGAIVDWADGFLKLIGRPPDELRGRRLWELASPKDRECLRRVLIEAPKYLECRRVDAAMVAGTGERRVAWSCSPVSYGGEDSIVAWGIDIAAKAGSNVETTASGLHSDLAARERELSAIYENVPGILFYVAVEPDGEFRFLSMSRAGVDATGLTREHFVGHLVRDVIPPPSRDMVLNHYREAIRSGQSVHWKEESVYPTGPRTAEVAVTPLYDATGVATHLIGIVHDITEHKNAEEALRLSEHKLRLSLQGAHLGTWQYDLTSGRFSVDDAGKVMHGLHPHEVVERVEDGGRHVHPDDIPGIRRRFERAIAERGTHDIEYRVVHSNGETRWVASLGLLQPGTSSFFGIVEDITARKRIELDLQSRQREQEHRLSLLLESAAQGILSVDASGLIVMANTATETMFGWARGELVGRPLERLVPAFRDRHAAYVSAPTPRSMGIGRELVGQRMDGSSFPIEISLNHVTMPNGAHAIAFVTDISARKQAEDALRRSYAELERRTLQLRRLASQLTLAEQHAREQLARTLHNGLQQLLFSAKVKLDRAVKSDFQADQAGLLHKTRADIDEAIEAARTLSVNLFPPVLHVGGLPAALAWLAKRTQEQLRVVVNVTADPRANPEPSDVRILLFEAVRELLFNAVKHAHVDSVDINLELRSDDTIHIEVSDKGVGFDLPSASNHEDLHQSGLGLFSIQERFALLGGHLDIQSAPGKGARFSLTVPRSDLRHLATGSTPQFSGRGERFVSNDAPGGRLQRLRILIADDHVVVRAGLRELFSERPGLQVVGEASNGVEVISQAEALQPDVIVMDVSMPKMNGIEATREIHGNRPHTHIVGLSSYDDEITERSMREAGAQAYFTKTEGADRLLDYLLSLCVPTH